VKTGQTVNQVQEIGRCGNSGNSTEPHLHFQFQDGKNFYFNSGLPIKFSGFSRRNEEQKKFIEQDYISKNTFVSVGE
jgi:murein DD-endopeptidase MepM/ murein hydrolase activator NlpD